MYSSAFPQLSWFSDQQEVDRGPADVSSFILSAVSARQKNI